MFPRGCLPVHFDRLEWFSTPRAVISNENYLSALECGNGGCPWAVEAKACDAGKCRWAVQMVTAEAPASHDQAATSNLPTGHLGTSVPALFTSDTPSVFSSCSCERTLAAPCE